MLPAKYSFHKISISIIYHCRILQVCSSETFAPRCGNQELIVMKQAVYGRMHRGKCMVSDAGLGCQKDVLHIFDTKCSNKETCQMDVFKELHSIDTPCPPEIVRFLEADYTCEPGKHFLFSSYIVL